MDSSKIENLKSVTLFSSLDEDDIKEIAFYCKKKSYRKNEVIFHQEDESNHLVILTAGQVKISLIDKNGKEAILKMVYQNDYFGEMSLLDGNFRSATITSIENSKALLISRDDFLKLLRM